MGNELSNPLLLIIAGLTLIIVILMMMKEYKVKNFKDLASKFDIKKSNKETENAATEKTEK